MPMSSIMLSVMALEMLPRSSWRQKKPKVSKGMMIMSSFRFALTSSSFVQSRSMVSTSSSSRGGRYSSGLIRFTSVFIVMVLLSGIEVAVWQ
jgi:hypothetical protein